MENKRKQSEINKKNNKQKKELSFICKTTYNFSKEFDKTDRKLKKWEINSFIKFKQFFYSLEDKTPFKDAILHLASYYSEKES